MINTMILPAFTIHQYIAGLQIAMNYIARMDEIRCIEYLIHNISFMDVFQNWAALNDIMQITFHELEW